MNFTISIRKESKLRVFYALGKDYRLKAQPRFRHVRIDLDWFPAGSYRSSSRGSFSGAWTFGLCGVSTFCLN
jgi:hypothetical protein